MVKQEQRFTEAKPDLTFDSMKKEQDEGDAMLLIDEAFGMLGDVLQERSNLNETLSEKFDNTLEKKLSKFGK